MKTGGVVFGAVVCAAALSVSCGAAFRPPFTQTSSANAPADDQQATLVFLWPTTSCDPGGYYVLATEDGRFLGTISPDTELRSEVPPGPISIVGWNEPAEKARGTVVKAAVNVLHGNVSRGRSYYVQLHFGDWDEQGPREVYAASALNPGHRVCLAPDHNMTSAMVRIEPSLDELNQLARWQTELDGLAPDRVAGQAWLDENRDALRYHRDVAEERFAGLRPAARRMVTVKVGDGMSGPP